MSKNFCLNLIFIFAVGFNAPSVWAQQTLSANGSSEVGTEQVSVAHLDVAEMPLKISAARPKRYGERFAVGYSVTNSTDKQITSFKVLFFIFDAAGSLVKTEDNQMREEIAAHATREWAYLLTRQAASGDHIVMALEEVGSEDGVWSVKRSKLEAAAKSLTFSQQLEPLQAQHEANLTLSEDDRREILRLALSDAIVQRHMPNLGFWDKQQTNTGKDTLDVYLLKKNFAPELLPQLPGVNLILLEPEEIQQRADGEGSIVYLSFGKFKTEGSTVIVALNISLAQSKLPSRQRSMGWGAGDTIEYHRESGKWIGKLVSSWIV